VSEKRLGHRRSERLNVLRFNVWSGSVDLYFSSEGQEIEESLTEEARPLFPWRAAETDDVNATKVNPTMALAITAREVGESRRQD
jgi:hypothetical protein